MNTTILASCRINRFWRFLSRSKSFACSCSYRPFETVKRFQSSNGDNRDDKKSDEENGWRLLLSLGVLASSLVALSVLKKCPQNQHGDGSDDDSQNGRWVTWKDFVNEMLSTGEIKRLVVAPEYKVVFIELHPGAIVKGRQVTSSSGVLPKYYKLKVSSVKTFENNLRKAEEDLGVPPGQGVLVHYARGSVGQIISYVFLGILIYALYKLFKAKTGTGPSSMFTGIVDKFRKGHYNLVDPSIQVHHRTRNYDYVSKRALSTSCSVLAKKNKDEVIVSYSLKELLQEMERVKYRVDTFSRTFELDLNKLKNQTVDVKNMVADVKNTISDLRGKVIAYSVIGGAFVALTMKIGLDYTIKHLLMPADK